MRPPRPLHLPWRFTPAQLDRDSLETTLVQRPDLVQQILERCEQAAAQAAPQRALNYLILGPRGTGKSHLLSLCFHRVRAREDLRRRLRLCQLGAHEWGVDSLVQLLLRVTQALAREYPESDLTAEIAALRELARPLPDKRGDIAELEVAARFLSLLQPFLGDRTLVLFCDNLDRLWHGLGETGQIGLLALLQERARCLVLATATTPFAAATGPEAPLRPQMQLEVLSPLRSEETAELLQRLGACWQDRPLLEYLTTPRGRARVRIIHHLCGGNPRSCVALAPLLPRESPGELLAALLDLADWLTPSYQGQVAALPAPQQRLLLGLCQQRSATAETLSRECLLSGEDATDDGALLRTMLRQGLIALEDGQQQRYTLQEPLLRLYLETQTGASPLPVVSEALRLFCAKEEMEARLRELPEHVPEAAYLRVALALPDPKEELMLACLREFSVESRKSPADPERGLRLADEMIALDQRDPRAWQCRTMCLNALSRNAEALESANRMVQLRPDWGRSLLLRGKVLQELGQTDDAIADFMRLTRLEPQEALSWRTLGSALTGARRYKEAGQALERALQIEPQDRRTALDLMLCLVTLGRYKDCVEVSDRHVGRPDADPEILALHGAALAKLGRHGEALEALDRSQQRYAARTLSGVSMERRQKVALLSAVARAGSLLAVGRTQEALDACMLALKIDPRATEIRGYKSQALYLLGRPEEAIATAREALALDGRDTDAWRSLGIIYLGLRRPEDALEALARLLQIEPEGKSAVWALGGCGVALLMLGRLPEARQALEQSLAREPDNAEVLTNLGVVLALMGEPAEACAAYTRSVALRPTGANLRNLGVSLQALGRHQQALEAFDRAVQLDPDNGGTWSAHGAALLHLGLYERAQQSLGRALERGEGDYRTLLHHAGALLAVGQWQAAYKSLRQGLDRAQGEPDEALAEATGMVLRHMLRGRAQPDRWPEPTTALVQLYLRSGRLEALGQALLRASPELRPPGLPGELLLPWLHAWQIAGGALVELQLALYLLATVVHFVRTGDRQVLLRLSAQERALLLPLLDVSAAPEADRPPAGSR